MQYRNEKKSKISKATIILAVVSVVVIGGVMGTLLLTGEASAMDGAVHSSSSPFSPMINYHDKPLVDPAASLAKQIEMQDGVAIP